MKILARNITAQMQDSAVRSIYSYVLVVVGLLLIVSIMNFIKNIKTDKHNSNLDIITSLAYIAISYIMTLFDKLVDILYLTKVAAICETLWLYRLALLVPFLVIAINIINILLLFINRQKVINTNK